MSSRSTGSNYLGVYWIKVKFIQLRSNRIFLSKDSLTGCDPVIKVEDLHDFQKSALDGKTLSASAIANPCGLQAKSYITGKNISVNMNKLP